MSSENQRPRRTLLHPLPVLRRVAIRERVVGGARERVTDLAGDLLLEPGGLLPQRLHARGAGGRGREETANRSRGGGDEGPGSGGLRPPPTSGLVSSIRPPRLGCVARPTLRRFRGGWLPARPFQFRGQPGRCGGTACVCLVLKSDRTGLTATLRYRFTGPVRPVTGIQIQKLLYNRFRPVYRPVLLVYRSV